MRARLHALWVSVLLLLPCQGSGAEEAPETRATAAVFESLESAWSQGDARGVVAHLGDRKVSITLPELEPASGRFSRSQSYFILKKHFENTQTLQFQFLDVRPPEGGRPVAVALAVRRYREHGAGPVAQDRVLVTLARDESRWVIAEITALR